MGKSEIWVEVSFCPVPDVLHHPHGADPHEDRFPYPVPCVGSIHLPVGIADLLPMLQNIHPGLSIPLRLSVKGAFFFYFNFPFLKNTKALDEKKDKDERK
jgi:hypothetical protein